MRSVGMLLALGWLWCGVPGAGLAAAGPTASLGDPETELGEALERGVDELRTAEQRLPPATVEQRALAEYLTVVAFGGCAAGAGGCLAAMPLVGAAVVTLAGLGVVVAVQLGGTGWVTVALGGVLLSLGFAAFSGLCALAAPFVSAVLTVASVPLRRQHNFRGHTLPTQLVRTLDTVAVLTALAVTAVAVPVAGVWIFLMVMGAYGALVAVALGGALGWAYVVTLYVFPTVGLSVVAAWATPVLVLLGTSVALALHMLLAPRPPPPRAPPPADAELLAPE